MVNQKFSSFGKMGYRKIEKGFPKAWLPKLTFSAWTLIVGIKSEFGQKKDLKKRRIYQWKNNFWNFRTFRTSNDCSIDHKKHIGKLSCNFVFFDWVFVRWNKLRSYGEKWWRLSRWIGSRTISRIFTAPETWINDQEKTFSQSNHLIQAQLFGCGARWIKSSLKFSLRFKLIVERSRKLK